MAALNRQSSPAYKEWKLLSTDEYTIASRHSWHPGYSFGTSLSIGSRVLMELFRRQFGEDASGST